MRPARTLLSAFLLASACAHPEVRRVGSHLPGDPAWPREEGRRIAWLGEIRGPENVGIERGFLGRVWAFVTGKRDVEGLYRPSGVAVDRDGRIAIADPGRHAVHLYDPARREARRIQGAGAGALAFPVAVAFVRGTLLVADADAGAVRAFDGRGRPVPPPVPLPALRRPVAFAVDEARGRLFVTDTAAHVVHVVPLAPGGEARVLGGRGSEPGRFNFPTHLAVDAGGRLAVCDAMNFRIQLFDADLRPAGAFGQAGDGLGDLARPKGIALDRDGVVFVLDGYYDVIQAFDGGGKLLGVFGGSGTRPGKLWLAAGMAVDASGRLYVADTYNGRVQLFDLEARTP